MNFATGLVFGLAGGFFVTVFVEMSVIIYFGFKANKKGGGYIETTEEIDT